jgi:phage/plasmid-like protein (TIGR03299 family)
MVINSLVERVEAEPAVPESIYHPARRLWTFPRGETDVGRALAAAHMDWEVEKREMHYFDNDGQRVIAQERAVVRKDTCEQLGAATDRYQCIQNAEAARLFEPLLENGGYRISAVGITASRRIWLTAKATRDFDITGRGDRVTSQLMGHWRHDGGAAISFQYLPVRVVCSNMVQRALNAEGHNGLYVRHYGNIAVSLNAVRGIFNRLEKIEAEDVGLMMRLARKPIHGDVTEFFRSVVVPPARPDYKNERTFERAMAAHQKILADMRQRYEGGLGLDVCDRNNYWAVLNAVTETVDHYLGGLSKRRDYVDYTVFGDGARIRAAAFETALAA